MHISLDAALQRQPLLSTVGDKLLPAFPGAAAAYSLRALNGDANNVVNVRRDADDEERDFTAEGVALELENWVNGKLETTLPADVDTAAAAYSLRKVRNAYSGNAVQIRRASDDVEVNVAFDSNGEVSNSSAITNIPSNFPTTEIQNGVPIELGFDTLTPNGLTGFSASAIGAKRCGYVINDGTTGEVVTVTVTISDIAGGNSLLIRLREDLSSSTNSSNTFTITSNGTYTFDLTATADFGAVIFVSSNTLSFTASDVSILSADQGDTTATTLGEFLTEGGNQDATVVTWYDQSGNGKDLLQDTTGNQPKIAENGSLLTLGGKPTIKPDGTAAFLQRIDSYWDGIMSSDFSVFLAANKTSDINAELIAVGDVASENSGFDFLMGGGGVTDNPAYRGAEVNVPFTGVTFSGMTLFSAIDSDPSTNGNAYLNSSDSFGTPAAQNRSGTADRLTLFARRDGSANYDGEISEVIIYASNQHDNRFKIESNINNYYGIYTAAYNGFVETWYDQSGNGNHAVQDFEGDQPKIVSAGSYLGELEFDSTDDFLSLTNTVSFENLPLSMFSVQDAQPTHNHHTMGCNNSRGLGVSESTVQYYFTGSPATLTFATSISGLNLYSAIHDGTTNADNITAHRNGVANSASSGTGMGQLNSSTVWTNIGVRSNTSDFFHGTIKEIIVYNSDQSANRTAIESNIADEYGITLP